MEIFRCLGDQMGLDFYRALFYNEGRFEAEFVTPNPCECLVLKFDSLMEAQDLLTTLRDESKKIDGAVIRKKCTKCFLHEREADIEKSA